MCTAGVESRTPANRHASLAISVPVIAFLFSRTNMLAHEAVRVISCPWSPLGVVALLRQWQWARAPAESTPSERYLKQLCGACLLVSWCVFFFFLLCRLISDEISQFYFNCCWQHVVSDKKHIFCRDCIHQLG